MQNKATRVYYWAFALLAVLSLVCLQTTPWLHENFADKASIVLAVKSLVKHPPMYADEKSHALADVWKNQTFTFTCVTSVPTLAYMTVASELVIFSWSLISPRFFDSSALQMSLFLLGFDLPLAASTLFAVVLSDVECGALLWAWTVIACVFRILCIYMISRLHLEAMETLEEKRKDLILKDCMQNIDLKVALLDEKPVEGVFVAFGQQAMQGGYKTEKTRQM